MLSFQQPELLYDVVVVCIASYCQIGSDKSARVVTSRVTAHG